MPHIEYIGSDGKVWPSATELTYLLPKNFLWAWYRREVEKDGWAGWLRCNATSEIGKKVGTAVHGHIESWTTGKDLLDGVDNSLEIAQALHNVVNPIVEEYVAIEPHLKSETLKLHGTADIIFKRKFTPGLRVGDYKTSFSKDKISHPIQLAIYARCWNEEHPDVKPEDIIDVGEIFRIDKKKLTVKTDTYTNLKQYYPAIDALRVLWSHIHEKGAI